MGDKEQTVSFELIGLAFGDYCLAYNSPGAKLDDPWAVGFLKAIMVDKSGIVYQLEGDNVPNRWFKHCRKITETKGAQRLANYAELRKVNGWLF